MQAILRKIIKTTMDNIYFEVVYKQAKLRGIFCKDSYEYDTYLAQTNKKLIKELYQSNNLVVQRIDEYGTAFNYKS